MINERLSLCYHCISQWGGYYMGPSWSLICQQSQIVWGVYLRPCLPVGYGSDYALRTCALRRASPDDGPEVDLKTIWLTLRTFSTRPVPPLSFVYFGMTYPKKLVELIYAPRRLPMHFFWLLTSDFCLLYQRFLLNPWHVPHKILLLRILWCYVFCLYPWHLTIKQYNRINTVSATKKD